MAYVVMDGRLPGMNEFITANRTNQYKGAKMKADAQKKCEEAIEEWLGDTKLKPPVTLKYSFYELNKKRDKDNISGFAHKVFQDALVAHGNIPNDGWAQIKGYEDQFAVDAENPRIVVMIVEG